MKLYPYQEDAVDKMYHTTGFLLGDDMGLGKTVTTLGELRRRSEDRDTMRTLVVCPKTVISTWVEHAPRFDFVPQVHMQRYGTPKLDKPDLFVITNWDQIRVNPNYKRVAWTYVIGDEIHNAKNRKAKRTRSLWTIPALYKRGLSGTPILNRPDELWAVIHWLYPNTFRSYWDFFNRFVEWEWDWNHQYRIIKGAKNIPELKALLEPFFMRRLKREVRSDLPEKLPPQKMYVELTPSQRRVYNEMQKEALAWVGKNEDKPLAAKMVIAQLMRLRQMCLGTPTDITYDDKGKLKVHIGEPSAKMDVLMEILDETDKPVLVYSNFRPGVEITLKRCAEAGISAVHLWGGMSDAERADNKNRFSRGEVRVMVATLGTGGEGVDGLQRSCSTVVFLDRHFTPGRNTQGEDRLHRDGQTEPVNIIHIEARNTVDQQVEAKIIWKWKFIKEILGG